MDDSIGIILSATFILCIKLVHVPSSIRELVGHIFGENLISYKEKETYEKLACLLKEIVTFFNISPAVLLS